MEENMSDGVPQFATAEYSGKPGKPGKPGDPACKSCGQVLAALGYVISLAPLPPSGS
jgi:hypothetical protein